MDLNAVEIAEQLTLLDWDIFKNISVRIYTHFYILSLTLPLTPPTSPIHQSGNGITRDGMEQ